jgi:uncharacterized protein (DUF2235 family)
MSKDIIVLFDGTGNKPEPPSGSVDDEPRFSSNVYRVWQAYGGEDLVGMPEIVRSYQAGGRRLIYVRGIGTDEPMAAPFSALGIGFRGRLRQALEHFAAHYEVGDRVFLFGFSRGAIAARCFANLLQHVGPNLTDLTHAFNNFAAGRRPTQEPVAVVFLGIWDSVASRVDLDLSNIDLSPANVENCRHALALDEARSDFLPTRWQSKSVRTRAIEAWFIGAHSNIGGGYGKEQDAANLANIAFFWILWGALELGLNVNAPGLEGYYSEHLKPAVDSYGNMWNQPILRILKHFRETKKERTLMPNDLLHASVLEWGEPGYAPLANRHPDCRPWNELRTSPWGFDDENNLIERVA